MNDSMSVWELNEYTRNLLENDILLQMVSVSGEISNYKRHSSGHIYFTLKDEKAKINCSFFKNYNSTLKFEPQNGMQVTVSATVSLYSRDGSYQLLVYRMASKGTGLLHERFEALKASLQEEGLFSPESKKPIPPYPKRIAVLASPTGAAVRDIISVTGRRSKSVEVIVVPVPVQGEGAAAQIAKALAYADNVLDADTIILARGGGSIEELWAFNEEVLARAVYACKTPVISGVGHETDFTICDFVADLRAPTPSVAAEIAVRDVKDTNSRLDEIMSSITRNISYNLSGARSRAEALYSSAAMQSPIRSIENTSRAVDGIYEDIVSLLEDKISDSKAQSEKIITNISAMNPYNVLSRGYAAVYSGQKQIKSAEEVQIGDTVLVELSDGRIDCTVNSTQKGKYGG